MKKKRILKDSWQSSKAIVRKWLAILKNKFKDYKVKTKNWASIMAFLMKTTNNSKDNSKIDKNQQERNCQNPKFGKMSTTIWFIFWPSTKTKKLLRQPFFNASKCHWFLVTSISKNSMTKIRYYQSSYKSIRKTSLLLKM